LLITAVEYAAAAAAVGEKRGGVERGAREGDERDGWSGERVWSEGVKS